MLEPVTFIAPLGTRQMDVEKSEVQVESWGWWWCWFLMMMMMIMMMMRMMTMMLMMRHCEGAAAWRDAQGMWREFTWGYLGGAWKWTFRVERSCSSLSPFKEPFGGIHCQTHATCGEKNTVSVSTNSNVSFCGTYGCSNLSLSSHRWVLGKWMSKNPNFKSNVDGDDDDDDDGDDDETLRRGCCVKRRTRHMAGVPFEGAFGGVPFSWSFVFVSSSLRLPPSMHINLPWGNLSPLSPSRQGSAVKPEAHT